VGNGENAKIKYARVLQTLSWEKIQAEPPWEWFEQEVVGLGVPVNLNF
jgi:hypothetical protein